MPAANAPATEPKPIRLADIAREAGVSVGVVSSFFTGNYYSNGRRGMGVSARTRDRVLQAGRKLNFQPADPSWRVRMYPETGDVCFLLERSVEQGFGNTYFSRIINGALARHAGEKSEFTFSNFDAATDYLINDAALPAPVRAGTASKFLLAGPPNYSLILAIQKRGFSVICLSRSVPLPGVVSVVPDYAAAAREGIGHLIKLGHRRIAVACEKYFTPDGYNTIELLRGTREAFAAAGLPFSDDDLIRDSAPYNTMPYPTFTRLAARAPRPTAVFCFDDWAATVIMKSALAAGLRLPDDLSIVGCNDSQIVAALHPALTTMHLPCEDMGATALETARKMAAGGAPAGPQRLVLPVGLVTRESTAAPQP